MPRQFANGELAALTKGKTAPPADWNGIYYTMEYVGLMGTNAAVLAGALGLPYSDEIGKLWHSNPSTRPLLRSWTDDYKDRFGDAQLPDKMCRVNIKQAMSLSKKPDKIPLFTGDTRPRISDTGVINSELTSLNMLWYCVHIMRSCPSIFPQSNLSQPVALRPVEVLGALKLLQFIRTYAEKGQLKQAGIRQQAIQPYFYAESPGNVQDPSIPSHEAVFGLPLEQMVNFVTDTDNGTVAIDNATSGHALEVERIIDQTLSDLQGTARTGVVLPPITPGERAVLVASLMKLDRFHETGMIKNPGQDDQSTELEVIRASAQAPGVIDACNRLGIDVDNLLYRGISLTEAQATAVAWMIDQEAAPVAGGILGDGCGMGKTRTALTFIHKAATMTTGPYQPTVVLCPAHTVSIWFQEAKSFGTDLQIIILYSSSKAVSDTDQRRATVDTLDDLRRRLGSLNPADPQVARTVVISSYATWSRRVTAFRLVGGDDEQENAIDEVEDEEATGQKRKRQYFSHLAGHFSRIICDEAHVLKNIATQTHQGIKTINAPYQWFLTGTPVSNRMVDLCGYLNLVYKEEFDNPQGPGYETHGFQEPPYHLLSAERFAAACKLGRQSAQTGYDAIPPVMDMLCLRRDIGDKIEISNDERLTIGAAIPPMAIETIYIKFPKRLQEIHDRHYFTLVENIYTGDSDDGGLQSSDSARCDWGVVRQLAHLSFSPRLFSFMRNVNQQEASSGEVAKYVERHDRGFTFFCMKTSTDKAFIPPPSRVQAARYLAYDCPKLKYLMKIFQDEGLFALGAEQPRFVIFCHWPSIQWMVEMFLLMVSIPFVSIRSATPMDSRAQAASHFNNPASDCRVFLTSYACGGTGLSLHTSCCRVVLMEPALNHSAEMQAIRRVRRLGQEQPQKVWRLFGQHTINRWTEHNNAVKYLPELAADLRSSIQTIIDQTPSEQRALMISSHAERTMTRELGQFESALLYDDLRDLGQSEFDYEPQDEQAKGEQAKDEQAKDEQAKDEQAKDEQAKDEQAKDEQAKDEQPQVAGDSGVHGEEGKGEKRPNSSELGERPTKQPRQDDGPGYMAKLRALFRFGGAPD